MTTPESSRSPASPTPSTETKLTWHGGLLIIAHPAHAPVVYDPQTGEATRLRWTGGSNSAQSAMLGGCDCYSKAPTIPTCRGRMTHLDDCPAKDSGHPVGVFAVPTQGAGARMREGSEVTAASGVDHAVAAAPCASASQRQVQETRDAEGAPGPEPTRPASVAGCPKCGGEMIQYEDGPDDTLECAWCRDDGLEPPTTGTVAAIRDRYIKTPEDRAAMEEARAELAGELAVPERPREETCPDCSHVHLTSSRCDVRDGDVAYEGRAAFCDCTTAQAPALPVPGEDERALLRADIEKLTRYEPVVDPSYGTPGEMETDEEGRYLWRIDVLAVLAALTSSRPASGRDDRAASSAPAPEDDHA